MRTQGNKNKTMSKKDFDFLIRLNLASIVSLITEICDELYEVMDKDMKKNISIVLQNYNDLENHHNKISNKTTSNEDLKTFNEILKVLEGLQW